MRRMPVAVLFGAFLASPSLAAACSCAPPTLEDLIESERDIAVFTARVVSVLTPDKGKPALVRLQIGEIIRGETAARHRDERRHTRGQSVRGRFPPRRAAHAGGLPARRPLAYRSVPRPATLDHDAF